MDGKREGRQTPISRSIDPWNFGIRIRILARTGPGLLAVHVSLPQIVVPLQPSKVLLQQTLREVAVVCHRQSFPILDSEASSLLVPSSTKGRPVP